VTARQTSRSSSTTETTSTVPALDMRRGHRSQPLSAGFGARRHSRRTPTASHARFRFRLLALVPHSRSEAAYATSARSLALRGNWNVSFTRNAWAVLSTRRGAWSPRRPRQTCIRLAAGTAIVSRRPSRPPLTGGKTVTRKLCGSRESSRLVTGDKVTHGIYLRILTDLRLRVVRPEMSRNARASVTFARRSRRSRCLPRRVSFTFKA
jgi:hypothetical protein